MAPNTTWQTGQLLALIEQIRQQAYDEGYSDAVAAMSEAATETACNLSDEVGVGCVT